MALAAEAAAQTIQTFTDLRAWRHGHALVLRIYHITKFFPPGEQFGLTHQLRRAAVSCTSNIAEGFGRNSYKEKIHFYSIAMGSLLEVQNQLLIAKDVGYLTKAEFQTLADGSVTASKIIRGLLKGTKERIQL